ncbi:MAG: hypothetical protein INF43_04450, partial [Alphaproteobacteria bacterium]|nr:hypothetical protein [Alphaproteobacteria bacterium]
MTALLTLPTPANERWKFTHLKRAVETLPTPTAHEASLRELEQALPILAVPQVVFRHGQPVPELGTPLPAGVTLRPLGAQPSGPTPGLDDLYT